MMGKRRPWRVFVHDIGPSYAYLTEERANDRARQLVETEFYAKVTVTDFDAPLSDVTKGWERTVFSWTEAGILTYKERWELKKFWGWYSVPGTRAIVQPA